MVKVIYNSRAGWIGAACFAAGFSLLYGMVVAGSLKQPQRLSAAATASGHVKAMGSRNSGPQVRATVRYVHPVTGKDCTVPNARMGHVDYSQSWATSVEVQARADSCFEPRVGPPLPPETPRQLWGFYLFGVLAFGLSGLLCGLRDPSPPAHGTAPTSPA